MIGSEPSALVEEENVEQAGEALVEISPRHGREEPQAGVGTLSRDLAG